MINFPTLQSLDKLEVFFKIIRSASIPPKFTYRYLAKLGFASSNDRNFISLLRKLGFIDNKNVPTQKYSLLRDITLFKEILGQQVLFFYKDIFEIDTNALFVPEDVLLGYFGRLSSQDSKFLKNAVSLFLKLGTLASFEVLAQKKHIKEVSISKPKINLNITLPTTTDEKVYESLFRHLKKLLR